MVKKSENGMIARFGDGSVSMNSGAYQISGEGIFALYSGEVGEIGRPEPKQFLFANEFYELKDAVILEFTKTESIDVLIDNLYHLKEKMIKVQKVRINKMPPEPLEIRMINNTTV